MSRETERKLRNAQKRLNRIEELVGPYAEDVTALPIRNRKQWIPGERQLDAESRDLPPTKRVAKVG